MLEWLGGIALLGLTGNWRGYRMGGKAIGDHKMSTDLKKKFEAARASGNMDQAKTIADKAQSAKDKRKAEKVKTRFNPDGKNATEAGFTIANVKMHKGLITKESQTASGTKILAEIGDGQVTFKINGFYNTSNVQDPVASGKLALRTLQGIVKKLPDGTLIANTPWDRDSKGASRARVYQKLGFGEALGVDDWSKSQYLIVKGGKPYPVDREFYERIKDKI